MKIHIVKKGDTLFDLSKKYNVPLEKLVESNPQLANPDELSLGDKVKIPAIAVPVGGEGQVHKHVVKQGDTLWKLSKAWGLPLDALVSANSQLADPNVLNVGDVVNIPITGNPLPSPTHQTAPLGVSQAPAESSIPGKKNTAPIAPSVEIEEAEFVPQPAPMPQLTKIEQLTEIQMPVIIPPPAKTEIKIEQVQYETVKHEPLPCPPMPEYPQLPSPQYYAVEQPPVILPTAHYQDSPCGCQGGAAGPGYYPDSHHLFYQQHIPAQKVYSPHQGTAVPYITQEQMLYSPDMMSGEYPGISNAPVYQSPQIAEHYCPEGHDPHPYYGGFTPYSGYTYSHQSAYPQMNYTMGPAGYGVETTSMLGAFNPYDPSAAGAQGYYSQQVNPMTYAPGYPSIPGMPGVTQQQNVPDISLGGFGGTDQINSYYNPNLLGRDSQSVTPNGSGSELAENKQESKAVRKTKAKKEVKVSGKLSEKSQGAKQKNQRSEPGTIKKRSSNINRRNPWINE